MFPILILPVALAWPLLSGLAGGAPGPTPPPGGGLESRPSARATVEPLPPLGVTVELASLQKNPRGGVASLLLKVDAIGPVASCVVTARVPGNLVFADGSQVRTWDVDLATAGTRSIPVDVIVPKDGTYVISVDVEGTAAERPIRRGVAHKLLVGVRETPRKAKDGAIEYPAVTTTEPQP
ncbi:MAG TPA: hypothetical protein VFB95_15290 [Candidatus Cryosericum sp.]|nr:hypothetical protein [Candidatus Cryosericum sp.]